ncbi:MAG: hypothetical protein MR526_05025 [Blautia sp.]|uniref:hypothetical protein n=1 Tax=Blautia sp. TaxID=1955243 RepID=UPI0025867692|nr:hypothetical protein [Blautia sp.]MCI7288809.1 hypothetical protein [Blautia sp.]
MIKKIKKCFIIILLSIFTLTAVEISPWNFGSYTVQAKASTSTKRKAQKAYRKFLTQRKYQYYNLWDVDKDGLKELIVTGGKYASGYFVTEAFVYTYTHGKIKYAGRIGSCMTGISYNKVSKRLHSARGGGGSIEEWYYTLTKNRKVKQVMCGAYVNGVKNGNVQYKCLYNGKRISYKKWNQITRKWIGQKRELNFYRNTAFNRKNNMKM